MNDVLMAMNQDDFFFNDHDSQAEIQFEDIIDCSYSSLKISFISSLTLFLLIWFPNSSSTKGSAAKRDQFSR